MPEASERVFQAGYGRKFTTNTDRVVGEVVQLGGGLAYIVPNGAALTADQAITPIERGILRSVAKATGVVLLDGDEAWWDYTNNRVTYKRADSQSFRCGVVVGDWGSGATRCSVDWNARPSYAVDLRHRDDPGYVSVKVGTLALGGFNYPQDRGGGVKKLVLDATNEAQKIDMLSKGTFGVLSHPIFDFAFTINDGGAGGTPDFNIGVASATHASDADAIAQYCFIHIDGNSTTIKVQAYDGTNTLAATTTGLAYTLGTRREGRIDLRNLADVRVYIDGARVLSSTTIDLSAAASAWKLLAHLEKTSSADVFDVDIERLRGRTQDQQAGG